MKKVAFIHVSDLHVTAKMLPGNADNTNRVNKTWLVSMGKDKDSENGYIHDFCKFIKKKYKDHELYLLIGGDIADSSEKIEYDSAEIYLNTITSYLNIPKDRILVIPGNHDINRYECLSATRNNQKKGNDKNPYLYFKEKYQYFSEFYKSFMGKTFPYNKQIVDRINICDEKILIVGINTNYKVDHQNGLGAVDLSCLEKELSNIKKSIPLYAKYAKIALIHHNVTNDYVDDKNRFGAFVDRSALVDFKDFLIDEGFCLVLTANQHTRSSGDIDGNLCYSDSGTLGEKDPSPSFKIYELEKKDNKTLLTQRICHLVNVKNGNDKEYGRWDFGDCENLHEKDFFVLHEDDRIQQGLQNANNILPSTENNLDTLLSDDKEQLPTKKAKKIVGNKKNISSHNTLGNCQNEVKTNATFQKELLSRIKSNGFFHQGHFHWGKNSRSQNWIDTIAMLNDRQNVIFIQNELQEHIKRNNIEYDFVIGVGIEGNIISTPLLYEDIPYCYLPYSFRYDDANDFEKTLYYNRENRKCNKALIITDVVFKGRMLSDLIRKHWNDFFSHLNAINIVSLFYTGGRILNAKLDRLNDFPTVKFAFYPMAEIEVMHCPYEKVEDCFYYSNNLCKVYKFYNDTTDLFGI